MHIFFMVELKVVDHIAWPGLHVTWTRTISLLKRYYDIMAKINFFTVASFCYMVFFDAIVKLHLERPGKCYRLARWRSNKMNSLIQQNHHVCNLQVMWFVKLKKKHMFLNWKHLRKEIGFDSENAKLTPCKVGFQYLEKGFLVWVKKWEAFSLKLFLLTITWSDCKAKHK
jgi:hypothetical protein